MNERSDLVVNTYNEMEHLSAPLIYKSLGYHGQPLLKIWEGERGENDLEKNGVVNPDFSTYQARQKVLTFQDRAKRLKLHQFIAKKAKYLFDVSLVEEVSRKTNNEKIPGSYAVVPTYEIFLNLDKFKRQRHFFNLVQPGEIAYGTVTNRTTSGMVIKLACTSGQFQRYVGDLNVKGYLPASNTLPALDKKNNVRNYNINDTVCCEILEVIPDSDKMMLTMKSINNSSIQFGLVEITNFPEIFKTATELNGESYESILEKSPGFANPHCIEVLSEDLGLQIYENYTNMSSLRGRFPQQDYSNELRQVQASKWAFRSVAEGIEHFKEGRHSEAFQCLNKALNIDPRNVEGLVARGALYANSGSFKKAVDDFETALKLNPSHTNARKYMGETLVALGRSYEEENKIDDARKAYQDCLTIIPHHEEAQNSLDFLKNKTVGKQLIEPGELMLPALNINKSLIDQSKIEREASSTSKKDVDTRKDKKTKKKKSKGNKRRSDSSTSTSESSESSESSSDSSSSSESSSSSDSDSNSKKKRHSKKSRQKSLSPLSKRMALMGDAGVVGDPNNAFQFNQPFGESSNQESGLDEYENKVRKFLEITRDEDDYEEKVRRFIEEASKYRKERKIIEEKAKKKKKKEARKLKKESKKRRKEKDREERKRAKLSKKDKLELDAIENKKLRDALKLFENFPLEELETKLSTLFDKNNSTSFESDLQNQPDLLYQSLLENETSSGKWKMAFAKDERKKDSQQPSSATKPIPKQYAFANESESDDERNTTLGAPIQHPPPPPPITAEKVKKRVQSPHPKSSKYQDHHSSLPALAKTVVKSGPVVLDKFGNFRLATMETAKPPEPPGSPRRNSRSRSRSRAGRKYSSSRSRSRSPRKRSRSGSYARKYSRSRSRSYRSRTRSRSRSRSYSRSRSRSRSVRRYDRRGFRGRGNFNDRGTYYKPRFNNHPRGGRGRGNYRDYRDYRGGRDRGRPFRPRAARGGGNRYYRNYREGSRDRRYSRDRSEDRERRSYSDDRPRSPHGDNENNKISPTKPENESKADVVQPALLDIEGRWADDKQDKSDKNEAPGTNMDAHKNVSSFQEE